MESPSPILLSTGINSMAKLVFKAKVQQIYNSDETPAYQIITVPKLTAAHYSKDEFRKHPKYGPYANSDLMPNLLAKLRREIFGSHIRLDKIPPGVSINTQGFLAIIEAEV